MSWIRFGAAGLALWLLSAAPLALGQTLSPSLAQAATVLDPAPVVAWNRTVAVFRATFEESSAETRAQRAAARIAALPPRGDLKVVTTKASRGGVSGIIVGTETETLFALLPGDVDPDSGETLDQVARRAVEELQAVLNERAAKERWPVLLRGLGFAAAATLVNLVVLWLVFRLRGLVVRRLDRLIAESQRTLALAGVNMAPVLLWIERAVVKLSFLTVFLATIYLWLTFCFQQFFYTQPWGKMLGAFFLGMLGDFALGIAGAVPGLVAVLLIFWLTRIVANAASGFFTGVERGTIAVPWLLPDSARASRRIVLVVIWMFALTVAYPYIPGSGSDAFKGISVFAGLMLSMGSSGFVNHIMSGLVIAYSSSLRPGDYVKVGEIEGTVEALGALSTKVITPKQEAITIPNGVVVGGGVTNYTRLSQDDGAWVSTVVTIGYDTSWRQVHALLLLAAKNAVGVRETPHPLVLQRALSDFYVEYELRFAIDRPEQRVAVLSELHAAIQDAFNEAGVQIMSPNFVAQPDEVVLVPKARWFDGPAKPPEAADGSSVPSREG